MVVLLSLFLGVVPAFLYAGFVYWLDRYEKEPKLLLGATFIWGALVAAGGAFILNTLFGLSVFFFTGSEAATNIATGSISAPLVEESLKGFAVAIVFIVFHKEFDNILDGIVYAAVAALGFAATENTYYIYAFGAEEGLGGILFLAFIRDILVGWQHPFYTAFIGIGLAVARLNRNWLVKIGAAFLGWMLAVLTHSFHNTIAVFIDGFEGLLLSTAVDWTGWAFMFAVVVWAIYRERKFLRRYLWEEVQTGLISRSQYYTATSAWAVSKARTNALFSRRFMKTRRFYHLCAELAHKKRQFEQMGEEMGNTRMIKRIRGELAQLAAHVVA